MLCFILERINTLKTSLGFSMKTQNIITENKFKTNKMEITIGNLVDQLGIVNIKIFMLEDKKRDDNASDKEISEATRKTNVLNSHRNNLIESIDLAMNEIAKGNQQKLFGQGST